MIFTKKQQAFLALAATIVFWGSAFPVIRVLLQYYQPVSIAVGRFLVAAIMFVLFNCYKGYGLPQVRHLPLIFFCGLCGVTIYHLALNYGEVTVQAGVASVIISTAPIFIAIAAKVFLKEALSWLSYVGIIIAFIGAAVLANINPVALKVDDTGTLMILLAAIVTAGYTVGQKPLLKHYQSLHLTGWIFMAGTVFFLPLVPDLWHDMSAAPLLYTTGIVYLGLFPSVIAYSFYTFALSRAGTVNVSSALYLSPVMSFLIAWLWLGEVPSTLDFIGCIIIFSGVVIVNLSRN